MSNADFDVAWCEDCQQCHLNGICPAFSDDANREMDLPEGEDWGDK